MMEKYSATVTQVVLGFFTQQTFACLPLYGPRDIQNLEEAVKTFEIPFTEEDYAVL